MVTTVPTTLPIGPKRQSAWITSCALELATLVSDLSYTVAYLASMQKETLRVFKRSINSEMQVFVIRQHTTHADRQLRELCTGWDATVDGHSVQIRWKTTDNIKR